MGPPGDDSGRAGGYDAIVSRRLNRQTTSLIVIDVQEKLASHIHEFAKIEQNIVRMVRGCAILGVETISTEQYPQGIGRTTPAVSEALKDGNRSSPIQKMSFSCQDCEEFRSAAGISGQILICGIETHVCVFQTAIDLLDAGADVQVVSDATSSRDPWNRDVALRRLEMEGARLTSTEMALFEMTRTAGTDEFRAISRLVK